MSITLAGPAADEKPLDAEPSVEQMRGVRIARPSFPSIWVRTWALLSRRKDHGLSGSAAALL
jgi:hypothetical protein